MVKLCWLFLATLLSGCLENNVPENYVEGTYIGYYHRNHQDTTQVTLVFQGNNFAAAPYDQAAYPETSGIFQSDQASLVFQNTRPSSQLNLNGTYHYEFNVDGSLRCWQEEGADIRELILKQQ